MTPSLSPSGVRLPQTHPPDKMARFLMLGWLGPGAQIQNRKFFFFELNGANIDICH